MSTACGHPQGGGGQTHVDACGQETHEAWGWEWEVKILIFLWTS